MRAEKHAHIFECYRNVTGGRVYPKPLHCYQHDVTIVSPKVKEMVRMQTALIQLGGKEWQKGDHHRIYFNYEVLVRLYGLKSNGFGHSVDGEKISGSRAAALDRQFQDGQFWYDVNTGQFNYRSIKEEWAEKIIQRINEALEAGVEAAEEAPPAEVEQPTAAGTPVRTAAGPGIQNRPVRPNKFGGYCVKCGEYVRAGEGVTYHIDPDEAYEHSGWVVEHKEGC